MAYTEDWDRPHRPGSHPLWQESDCYWFYDADQGVGGFHRIGQSPNLGIGQVMLFAFDRAGQRYRSIRHFPVHQDSRWETGQRVASSEVQFLGDERMGYTWRAPETEADLLFAEGFYRPRDWSTSGRARNVLEDINADGHLECSGRITGELRIGVRTYVLNALAHRDRSWGPRDHSVLGQHRMFSGTVGPEFSVACFTFGLRQGGRHCAGFIVRNGTSTDIQDLRVLTTFDNDGHTTIGAETHIALADGEKLVVKSTAIQGFLGSVDDICFSSDTISAIEFGGKTGFVDLEVTNNPIRGKIIPNQEDFSVLAVDEGLSTSRVYDFG